MNENVNLQNFAGPRQIQIAGDCVPNGTVADLQYQLHQSGVADVPMLNRLQNYYDAREWQGQLGQDLGVSFGPTWNNSLLVASTKGISAEPPAYYQTSNINTQPSADMYQRAGEQKITGYHFLDPYVSYYTMAGNIASELEKGKPVIVSLSNFEGVGKHCVVIDTVDFAAGTYGAKNWWDDRATISFAEFQQTFNGAAVVDGFTYGGKTFDWNWTTERKQVAELYGAIFNRAVEFNGINFWDDIVHTYGFTQAANCMFASAEAQSRFGNDAGTQVDLMYQTVLGRHAVAPEIAYYKNFLDHGYGQGDVLNMLVSAVDSYAGTEASMIAAADRLHNRTNVSEYYALALQADDNHGQVATVALVGVTDDAATAHSAKDAIFHALYS